MEDSTLPHTETREELAQDIHLGDKRTCENRLERYEFFFTLPEPENGLWLHEAEVARFIEEAFWCYIEGHFVACVLLCQATLENLFRHLAPVNDKAGFYEIIESAHERNLISDEERVNFHRLRTLRNQFTHVRPASHREALWRQRTREGQNSDEQTDEAAKFALRTMFGTLARPPFAL